MMQLAILLMVNNGTKTHSMFNLLFPFKKLKCWFKKYADFLVIVLAITQDLFLYELSPRITVYVHLLSS